jgi:hypothetical protein
MRMGAPMRIITQMPSRAISRTTAPVMRLS